MALKIDVPYRKSFESAKNREETFKFLADVEKAIPPNFPGLESFTRQDGSTFHWKFQKVEYSSYKFQIQVLTRIETVGSETIRMVSVPKEGFSSLKGEWHVEEKGKGSLVTFAIDLQTELPVPFFLKAMAAPITQKEIGKIFDRYLANVGKALS